MFPLLAQLILIVIASICKGKHENTCNVFPKDQYIEVGSDTKVVCHSSCVPGKISWTLNKRVIDESLSHTINSSHTVLSLRNFTEHSATVLCRSAATEEVLGGTTIRTYSKPSKISCILDYDNQEAGGVPELLTCNWEHQINPSKDINYTVLSASWLHPFQSEICNSRVTTCTSKYKTISDKILLFGDFNITVRAKSADFEAYSETQDFTSYHIWKIVRPKLEVTPRPDSLLVKWTQMDSSTESQCFCQVKYSKAINERTTEWVIDKALNCEDKGEMIIDKVDSCSTYKFAVRCALAEAPWSDWSLEKKVLTKLNMTDVKLRLWRKVAEPLKNGLRTVRAMWTGIPSTCQDTFTYMIKQQKTGENSTQTVCGNATCDVEVNQDAHRITLTVLQNDTLPVEDSVYVPAVGESLPQVTDIQTRNYEGVLLVSWKAPIQPVSGYMIDYTHDGNQFHWMETKYTNVKLIGLLDKKPYNITVTPLLDGRTGHGTQALQICSRVGDPGNVSIVNVEAYDKSAFVSWDVTTQKECSDAVVRYTVFYTAQNGPQLNVTADGKRQYISLKDLTPDTQYHLYVQATARTGSTQSSEWLFITKRFDPRLVTALLVCGSISMVLVLSFGLCCAVQWKKFKDKPVPNPGDSSVAGWSLASHQQPFSIPCESHYDRVYPEGPRRKSTPPLPKGRNPTRDQMEEYTVPDIVPSPDTQNKDPAEPGEFNPSSPGESTALLLLENNQLSPYRSQSSVEAAVQGTGKQSKHVAVKQQEKTGPATVYVTLDMFDHGNRHGREIEAEP
uniref:interleukin-31 receptor subunit alpha-like n=1 Tax=Semicossyphus pulcher TaxID=241346 RepID=UPI0037E87E8F